MSEPVILVLLLVILVVPAVLIARTARRLGAGARHRQQLALWAEMHGWRLPAAEADRVGRWQFWPFSAADREVSELLVGEHRGREAASFRLAAADGDRHGVFHVLTISPGPTRPVTPLLTDGVLEPRALELFGHTGIPEASRIPPGMSARLEHGVVVGWLPGEPLCTELDSYLDLLTDLTPLSPGPPPSPRGG